MGSLLLALAVIVIIALGVLFGFLRGLAKSRIRGICVLASAIIAVCATLIFKSTVNSESFVESILPWLRDQGMGDVKQFLEISPTLNEIVLKCLSSLIAPLLTLVFFLITMFITWIIYLVLTLVLGNFLKAHNERAKYSLVRALIWGAVQGIVIVVVLLMPISSYLDLTPRIMDAVLETDVMDEDAEKSLQPVMDEVISPLNNGGTMKVYRALGGKALTCLVTDFEIAGERTHLNEEIDSVAAFACNIVRLTKTEFSEYSSDEAVVIVAIADSFEESVLLPAIAGEVIYGATDAWLNGQAFLGMEKPTSKGEMAEITDELLLSLIRILHADARNYPALQSDIRTVADIVASMADHEIFAKIDDSDALLLALSQSGVVKELIVSVGENDGMKILIPQLTNVGIKTVALTLEIPADKSVLYSAFLTEVKETIESVSILSMDDARIKLLSTYFSTTVDNSAIGVPQELSACIALALDRDLMAASKAEKLTDADVAAFFRVYAAEIDGKELSSAELASTVYADMSREELENSGAAALAKALKAVSLLPQGEGYDQAVTAALLDAFALTDDAEGNGATLLKETVLTAPLTEEPIDVLASLASADTFKTDRVTMEDLLIDPTGAAAKLNGETIQTEADAINSVFVSIEGLLGGEEETDSDIVAMAEPVGAVLDALKTGEIYGAEMTAKLFTAVLQSDTLREAAKLSVKTATEMAKKATSGDVNYTETFMSIARSVTVLTELGDSGNKASDEDLVELVENINPQSAGMLEVYVNAERIEDYGVSSKYSGTSADLLSSTFGYMADNEMEDPEAEAKALNRVLDIAISANSHSSGQQLFSDEDREGILPSATETVETIVASQSVSHSLRENLLDEEGNVIEEKKDSFDLGRKLEEGSAEHTEFVAALDASYQANPTVENKQTLTALASLFGIQY